MCSKYTFFTSIEFVLKYKFGNSCCYWDTLMLPLSKYNIQSPKLIIISIPKNRIHATYLLMAFEHFPQFRTVLSSITEAKNAENRFFQNPLKMIILRIPQNKIEILIKLTHFKAYFHQFTPCKRSFRF